ncbi:SGNH/GDSL hydrolase family protein [Teredinibacter haidensis]|uniref:SGNH/GDSL hydrolase family protein n=1 Tax=Teredinibacter haidensis TaxID=2731755 RepID=UPI0009F86649|nr:SGNH/GDSL hydrolase family protein [Teredinibacter haidensis]
MFSFRRLGLGGMAAALLLTLFSSQVLATRIMPLGDSITGSPGCWRAYLWQQLSDAGYRDIDFVGSLSAPHCGFDHDADNEGHGGFLARDIANDNSLVGWLETSNPEVVLMHLGTNDVWNSVPTTQILSSFTALVEDMRDNNSSMKILVAQIIPMEPTEYPCSSCYAAVEALNGALVEWAQGLSTATSPIGIVDVWTGFDVITDTSDGVHPNTAGHQKLGSAWFDSVKSLLDGEFAGESSDTASSSSSSSSQESSSSEAAEPSSNSSGGGGSFGLAMLVILAGFAWPRRR